MGRFNERCHAVAPASHTDESELLQVVGLLIAMTIVYTPTGDQRGYWNGSALTDDSFLMGPNFGRFMSYTRF